jgi:hypothetical protein
MPVRTVKASMSPTSPVLIGHRGLLHDSCKVIGSESTHLLPGATSPLLGSQKGPNLPRIYRELNKRTEVRSDRGSGTRRPSVAIIW